MARKCSRISFSTFSAVISSGGRDYSFLFEKRRFGRWFSMVIVLGVGPSLMVDCSPSWIGVKVAAPDAIL
jgi:hypothetical protein